LPGCGENFTTEGQFLCHRRDLIWTSKASKWRFDVRLISNPTTRLRGEIMINLAKLEDDLASEYEEALTREASEDECNLWEILQTTVHLLRNRREDGYFSLGGEDIQIHFPSSY
jgi:hypothetical protein